MPSHLKVDDSLDASELEELRAWCGEKKRTVDDVHRWLQERRFTMSRSAAWKWLQSFEEEQLRQRFSRSGELAAAVTAAVKNGSFDAVADAATMQLTQVVFEQATQLQADGQIDPLDIARMATALRSLVRSKAGLIAIYQARFDREMKLAAEDARKKGVQGVTPEQIIQARKMIFGT
jgi:hypothetical protein